MGDLFRFLFMELQKAVPYCAAGHSHRAFHDGDIFFPGIQVRLFVTGIGVAFLGYNEAGRHLYPGTAQGEIVVNVLSVEHTSCKYYRNALLIFSS